MFCSDKEGAEEAEKQMKEVAHLMQPASNPAILPAPSASGSSSSSTTSPASSSASCSISSLPPSDDPRATGPTSQEPATSSKMSLISRSSAGPHIRDKDCPKSQPATMCKKELVLEATVVPSSFTQMTLASRTVTVLNSSSHVPRGHHFSGDSVPSSTGSDDEFVCFPASANVPSSSKLMALPPPPPYNASPAIVEEAPSIIPIIHDEEGFYYNVGYSASSPDATAAKRPRFSSNSSSTQEDFMFVDGLMSSTTDLVDAFIGEGLGSSSSPSTNSTASSSDPLLGLFDGFSPPPHHLPQPIGLGDVTADFSSQYFQQPHFVEGLISHSCALGLESSVQ